MTDHTTEPTFNWQTIWNNLEKEAMKPFVTALSRRDFIKFFATGVAATTFGTLASNRAQASTTRGLAPVAQSVNVAPTLPNGVAAGDVTHTSAMLWTRSTATGDVTFEVATGADSGEVLQTLSATVEDEMLPVKVAVENLEPGTTYTYRVTDAAGATLSGVFRTPAADGETVPLRFGVAGDWRGELRPYPAIKNAPGRDLEFFVLHGDTIYADIPSIDFSDEQAVSLAEFRVKHNEVYSDLQGRNYWADLRAATAVFATIDDHEVTNDFAGGAAPSTDDRFNDDSAALINQTAMYVNGLQALHEYNPMRDEVYSGTDDDRMEGRPKLYRYQTYGSTAAVIVLDARSFRDESVASTDDPFNQAEIAAMNERFWTEGRTMLGRTQVEDLKSDLLAAQENGITWKFVMIPEPMQHQGWLGGNDRWEGYAPERTEVMQFIEDNGIRNVVFIAADVHTTFINDVTYQTEANGEHIQTHAFEVTTGPVAFWTPTGAAIVAGARDFGLVTDAQWESYQEMSDMERDEFLQGLFNRLVLGLQGYDALGFGDASLIDGELTQGNWVVGHTYGWTEFDIDADGVLTITTYGVPAYSREMMTDDPAAFADNDPQIMSEVVVRPQM